MYDAIVIGGRVAGAPTAMLLARLGHRVLLVERTRFPRDTLSTHFIWPRGVSYLNRWGLAQRVLAETPGMRSMEVNIEGISLKGSVRLQDLRERFTHLHGDDHGVTDTYCGPRRFFLDNLLLREAQAAGAEVREGFSVVGPMIEDGVVVGIHGRTEDGIERSERARLVIAADGRFSRFAEQVGSKVVDFREKSTFAYFSYFRGIPMEELAIHKRGRMGTAIFPTMEGKHMVLVYGPTHWWREFRRRAEANFHWIYDFCAPEIGELIRTRGTRVEGFYGAGIMSAFKREATGPGWVLIGDAGSFKDQVTAMGITHAFRDAQLLTDHLHRAFTGEMSVPEALNHFVARRSVDYDEYFDLVCGTAEMNIYTEEQLELYEALRGNQDQIDRMISCFGDTLPAHQFASADNVQAIVSAHRRLPKVNQDYDSLIADYDRNPFIDAAQTAAA